MIFRDTDDRSSPQRGTVRRLEHRVVQLFTRDWSVKLVALAVTFALWYGVTGRRQPITRRFHGVQLVFRVLNDMEISNDPRNEVDLTLTGSKAALDAINPRDLVASMDVKANARGEHIEQLTPGRIHLELPEGMRLESVDPNKVSLLLEPRVQREIEVEVRLGGKLPDGYDLKSVNVSPSRVTIRGPESHVMALQRVPTATISLEGRVASFTSSQTSIEVNDTKVDILNPAVDVYMTISELRVETKPERRSPAVTTLRR